VAPGQRTDLGVRQHVTAAAAFLEWLEARELTTKTCNQADLDLWLADHPGHRTRSAKFARVGGRPPACLPAHRTEHPLAGGRPDHWTRTAEWADARRLLHDDSCPVADCAAGLLFLLYAQKLSNITALTTEHVRHQDGHTLLHLGSRPITLPSPLDALIDELVTTGQTPGSTVLTKESAWLFPGRWHGRPLTEGVLSRRLQARARPAPMPDTALLALAAELPAAILAKTLGIHIKGAIQWQKIAAGDWAAYPADISQRSSRTHQQGECQHASR
jgi:hypothetical protein